MRFVGPQTLSKQSHKMSQKQKGFNIDLNLCAGLLLIVMHVQNRVNGFNYYGRTAKKDWQKKLRMRQNVDRTRQQEK